MVHLVHGPDMNDALAKWAAAQIPHVSAEGFGPCQAIGIVSGPGPDAEIYGVFIAHDYQQLAGTIQMTVAARSPKWVWACRQLFRYLFDQLKVNKIWTATPHTHVRALKWNIGIGMRREAVLRHHFGPGVHAVICSMLEKEYRTSRWCGAKQKEAA